MKPFLKAIKLTVLSLLILFLGIVIYLWMIRVVDQAKQKGHMRDVEEMYQEDYVEVDEQFFADFMVTDATLKLNEVQFLASHNSYKKMGSGIGKFFVGLGDSFAEARALQYSYHPLTYQLEQGIRSFELDVRLRQNKFELTHVPLVDNSSTAVNFFLALEEIRLYSEHNPNHLPLLILLEFKTDWMMLDPFLQNITEEELVIFDAMLEEVFGDDLFTPRDMLETDTTLRETITTTGWPTIQNLLGKVLFIMHPSETFVPMYYQMDDTLSTQNMFLGANMDTYQEPYASFIVHNDPNFYDIRPLVAENFIVRTRLDASLQLHESEWENGIRSGAQILSSDFTIGRSDLKQDEVKYLEDLYTMIKNRYLLP